MKRYNFREARDNFASVLEVAKQEGIICILKRDGMDLENAIKRLGNE